MFRNYLKVAWRNIFRRKAYSIINILGLALGISACLVIYVISSYEFGFDTFHKDKGRIYRIVEQVRDKGGRVEMLCNAPPPAVPLFRSELTGVEDAAGFDFYNARVSIPGTGAAKKEFDSKWQIVVTDENYFRLFNYEWLAGDPKSSMARPFSVVLTEKKAKMYFGDIPYDQMMGRWVAYDDSLKVSVSGIVKDWEKSSDFAFTDFITYNTARNSFLNTALSLDSWSDDVPHTSQAFVKLGRGVRESQVTSQFPAFCKAHLTLSPGSSFSMGLQPLSDIHFNADYMDYPFRKAYKPMLYGLCLVAAFILVIAAFNFINLSTAQALRRAKEIGVRKVLGSSRGRLILQHLTETLLITILAVCVSLACLKPVLLLFQSVIPDGAGLRLFSLQTLSFIIGLIFVTCLLAGLYPARRISAFLPVQNLNDTSSKGSGGTIFRKALIIFQFTISLVFIIGAIIVDHQLQFMQSQDLGFVTEGIITVNTNGDDNTSKAGVFADRIRNMAGIGKVALQSYEPMSDMGTNVAVRKSISDDKRIPALMQSADENWLGLYQIGLYAGRNISNADSAREVLINESLAKSLGYTEPAQAVDHSIYFGRGTIAYTITGVTADFHEHSYEESIRPLIIMNMPSQETSVAIKFHNLAKNSSAVKQLLTNMEKEWKAVYPKDPFNYYFFDDAIAALYKREQDVAKLMNTAMLVTLFVSCIGLFGLAMFAGEQRKREIGIRKAMGASVRDIVLLLSRDFMLLVFWSFLIASPLAWFFFNKWLLEFAYRIGIQWWVFALAGLGATAVAMITVGYQAIKAARVNPAISLRVE